MQGTSFSSGGRYPVLRTVAILYLVAGAISCIAGIVAAVWEFSNAPDTTGHRVALGFVILAATFLFALGMVAIAEVLKLFIDIEHNSRTVASHEQMAAPASSGMTTAPNGERMQWLKGEETAEGALMRGH
jgi:hypothetical protein